MVGATLKPLLFLVQYVLSKLSYSNLKSKFFNYYFHLLAYSSGVAYCKA